MSSEDVSIAKSYLLVGTPPPPELAYFPLARLARFLRFYQPGLPAPMTALDADIIIRPALSLLGRAVILH